MAPGVMIVWGIFLGFACVSMFFSPRRPTNAVIFSHLVTTLVYLSILNMSYVK
jgi:hypothetical protein